MRGPNCSPRARTPALAQVLFPALVLVLAACGSGAEPQAPEPEASSGAESAPARAPAQGMEVSGLYGTIPARKIEQTLEPKLPRFQRCFMQGAERVEFIGGRIEFYFRVGLDGRVEWVYPRASTIGDRATEKCLLEIARATRFPEPKGGGAAEIAWGFEIDASEDVRAPVALDSAQLSALLATNTAALQDCGAGSFSVTAYVAPGGGVLAAGAAVDSNEAAARVDCVLDAIKTWNMPDPGSYPAKVSFSTP